MESELSIGAIVFRKTEKTEFLILKRNDNGIWEFPKGHKEPQETESNTLKRELFEELGFSNYSLVPNFRGVISYKSSSKNVERKMVFYLISSADDLKISKEHLEFKWITLDEAPNYFKYQDIIDLLKKVISRVKKGEG